MRLSLPDVTLLGIDCVDVARLETALKICARDIDFGAVKLLTSLPSDSPSRVEIPHIGTIEEYSRFCIAHLDAYVDTRYVLLVQYDGFVLNPQSWTDEFLGYDYIGAPWLVQDWSVRDFDFPPESIGTHIVGNGGFSIRSKRFLETSARLARDGKIARMHPEDVALCVWYKHVLEYEGMKFAPAELAARFSIEGEDVAYETQFGFHGLSWTNIDAWMDQHPEYPELVAKYKHLRKEHAEHVLASKQ